MRENRLLYQIKTLDKLILRNLIDDIDKLEQLSSHPTPTQMQIIEYIIDHGDQCVYQKDLEEILNLRRATVSGVLQTMEKNGLIERIIHDEDARVKRIILNDRAKKIFSRNQKRMEELETVIIKGIPSDKLKDFSLVLGMMKENLKNNSIKDERRKI